VLLLYSVVLENVHSSIVDSIFFHITVQPILTVTLITLLVENYVVGDEIVSVVFAVVAVAVAAAAVV
jgi:hypothetical protein